MALTADDKKLFRKHIAEQAQRTKRRISSHYQTERAAVIKAGKDEPLPEAGIALLETTRRLANDWNNVRKQLQELGLTIQTPGYHYHSFNHEFTSIDQTSLRRDGQSAETTAQIQKLDEAEQAALEAVDTLAANAQLTMIAQDVPGLQAQLETLAAQFNALAQGA